MAVGVSDVGGVMDDGAGRGGAVMSSVQSAAGRGNMGGVKLKRFNR